MARQPPRARETAAAAASRAGSTARRRSALNRAGPWRARIATSAPSRPRDRRGERAEVRLALALGLRPALLAHGRDLARQPRGVGDRPLRVGLERRRRLARVGEQHLAGRRGVGDARPAEPGHAHDAARAGDEVDGDGAAALGHRQRRRLAGLLRERAQLRARGIADVEPREHAVGERDEVQPEPVRAAGVALDQAAGLERREQPRRARRVDADPPRQRVDARRSLGERVEQRHGAGHGADLAPLHGQETSSSTGRCAAWPSPASRRTSIIASVAGER